ncbi:uncharacterized protein [Montipora capricornis]|uniref:uncharacterized protein n=1 Tax=Montipora capricornis TaxID=246305 RepID=UPI0035F199C5
MTEGGNGVHSTVPIIPAEIATNQTNSLDQTEANAVANSIYYGDGGAGQPTEQSHLMAADADQRPERRLSDAVVGSAVQTTRSSQSNQSSVAIGGQNNGRWQSGSPERGGATSTLRRADMTVEQASGRDYPIMRICAQQVSPHGHIVSENVHIVVYFGECAQQINGLPGNHEEEPLAEGARANGLNIHRAESAWHARYRNYVDNSSGDSSPVTYSPVQEQGNGYAAAQAPILPPDFQPGEANLVSSMGNAKKPTEHCCSTEEIN